LVPTTSSTFFPAPAAAALLDEEPPLVEVLLGALLLEPLEQAARAIGMTAATAMPATRTDFRCAIRSS
jgi:hypothetical protein